MSPLAYLIAAAFCTWLLFVLDKMIQGMRGRR
jgi:hypothetical protein